jgi:hypothetical protein
MHGLDGVSKLVPALAAPDRGRRFHRAGRRVPVRAREVTPRRRGGFPDMCAGLGGGRIKFGLGSVDI